MDGFKSTLKNSLQARLAIVLSSVIALTALVAGGVSFYKAFNEANELQDDILRQVAALIRSQGNFQSIEQVSDILKDLDLEIEVKVQALDTAQVAPSETEKKSQKREKPTKEVAQEITRHGHKKYLLPHNLSNGLHTLALKSDTFRVLVSQQANGQGFAVMQETELRDELALSSAMRTIMPLLMLIPILVSVVFLLVRAMFKPIKRLSQQLGARDEQDLSALSDENLPNEITPFVQSINSLLEKVDLSMQQQRCFVADAAHELRTPMTALSLQVEHLANAPMSEVAEQRVTQLCQGIERSRHLLEQLLGLARAQEKNRERVAKKVVGQTEPFSSIREVYREAIEGLMPLIELKQMDVGVLEGPDVQIQMHKLELSTITKNLVDNAIRYSPNQGQIDLSAYQEGKYLVLEIRDNGPGIDEHDRARVCEPFYRVLGTEQQGSGLGLSIVQTLIKNRGGELELLSPSDSVSGLLVRVKLPLSL